MRVAESGDVSDRRIVKHLTRNLTARQAKRTKNSECGARVSPEARRRERHHGGYRESRQISRQAVYLHFADRADLMVALVRRADEVRGLGAEIRFSTPPMEPPRYAKWREYRRGAILRFGPPPERWTRFAARSRSGAVLAGSSATSPRRSTASGGETSQRRESSRRHRPGDRRRPVMDHYLVAYLERPRAATGLVRRQV
jgi:AcrR family transcriptional regulator